MNFLGQFYNSVPLILRVLQRLVIKCFYFFVPYRERFPKCVPIRWSILCEICPPGEHLLPHQKVVLGEGQVEHVVLGAPVLNTVLPTKYLHMQSTELCLAPKYWPPTSLSTQRVCPPPAHSPGGEEVNILKDARHRIGLLQYNLSTVLSLPLPFDEKIKNISNRFREIKKRTKWRPLFAWHPARLFSWSELFKSGFCKTVFPTALFLKAYSKQRCECGMFIPDPRYEFFGIPDPGYNYITAISFTKFKKIFFTGTEKNILINWRRNYVF